MSLATRSYYLEKIKIKLINYIFNIKKAAYIFCVLKCLSTNDMLTVYKYYRDSNINV